MLISHFCKCDYEQVRFFYSFTCRENLYLVMEYLNGGDIYSLLRNLGCLDEDMARVYIAEIVRECYYFFFPFPFPILKIYHVVLQRN